ncbi:hypothetical protein F5Y16DRAFT_386524 [Xylariaceae sp. FL0255]|nr:hypothetical protein F5Y16DRAFT_386524 [Xylariaceae sp. FL0255]
MVRALYLLLHWVRIWGRDEYAPEFANSASFLVDVLRALSLPLEFDAVFTLTQDGSMTWKTEIVDARNPLLQQSGMHPQLWARIAAAIHAHAAMIRRHNQICFAHLDHDCSLFRLDRHGTPTPCDNAELWLYLAHKLDQFCHLLSNNGVLVVGMVSRLVH